MSQSHQNSEGKNCCNALYLFSHFGYMYLQSHTKCTRYVVVVFDSLKLVSLFPTYVLRYLIAATTVRILPVANLSENYFAISL